MTAATASSSTLSPGAAVFPAFDGGGLVSLGAAPHGAAPRELELFVELKKSFVDKKTGRVYVRGIASDNSVDFTNDIVQISQISTALSVLNRGWGKFNFDHHAEVVGEITRIAFITPADALARYNVECVGVVLEIEGWVYPITDKTPPHSDVREVHKLIDVEARLGFSVQGGIGPRVPSRTKDGKIVNVATAKFVNQVAITPQPINMNTLCLPFAKSLAAVLTEGGMSMEDWGATQNENELPPLLFCGEEWNDLLKSAATGAALGSSGTQAVTGVATGGDATRLGASEKGDDVPLCCQCEKALGEAGDCAHCGAIGKTLRKSLRAAALEFFGALDF